MTSPMPFRIVQGLNGIRNPVKGIEGGGGNGEKILFLCLLLALDWKCGFIHKLN